jgi:hypothetical protein
MAFMIHSVDDGRVLPIEYIPCGAITPKVGMALVQTAGNAAIATGTTVPTYISMIEKEVACVAGEMIPVVRVQKDVIYETENSASFASVKVGTKVTLATDGLRVTATATDGVAEVVDFDEVAAAGQGGKVRVRF